MAGTALSMGLSVLSVAPIPGVSEAAGISIGVMDICTGSPVTGVFVIVKSVTPFGKIVGAVGGKVISAAFKGRKTAKAAKIVADVIGAVDASGAVW